MRAGRDAEPTAAVIDSQSVKADAVVGVDSRGFDGGKLINGRTRRVVVDTLGLLLGVMVTAADTGDRAAAEVLLRHTADAHHLLALVWADGGYTGSLVEYCLAALALVLAISSAATTCAASWCCPSDDRRAPHRPPDAQSPSGARLQATHHQCRGDGLLVDDRSHNPPPGEVTACARVNRPSCGSASQRVRPGVSPSTAVLLPASAPRPCRTPPPSHGRSAALDGAGPVPRASTGCAGSPPTAPTRPAPGAIPAPAISASPRPGASAAHPRPADPP